VAVDRDQPEISIAEIRPSAVEVGPGLLPARRRDVGSGLGKRARGDIGRAREHGEEASDGRSGCDRDGFNMQVPLMAEMAL
jgi:hypothetical protein